MKLGKTHTKKERSLPSGGKIHIFQSLKFKVVSLVLLSIVISVVSLLLTIVPIASSSLTQTIDSYMRDVCDTCGFNVDAAISRSGNTIMNPDYLGKLIGDVRINNLESSYASMIGSDGTFIYHPSSDMIGQSADNEALQTIADQLSSGSETPNGILTYSYEGTVRYAAYYVVSNQSAFLVISADKNQLLGATTQIIQRSIIAAAIIFIVLGLIAYFMSGRTIHPILSVAKVINRFSSLDFTESETAKRVSRRGDETGQIARAILALQERISNVVSQIQTQSQLLYSASSELSSTASHTTSTVGNVETAVSEIAAGAGSQAAETQKANDDILNMGNMIQSTHTQADELNDTATLMRSSSDEASATLQELDSINKQAIASIDIIYEQTNTTNASALKIKEATTLISSIAEETNLLSLNASIEAARAGDAGRGFAVVASEIQKLADQSNSSASQIDTIIRTLIDDSQKAVETMDTVRQIMQQQSENVTKTGQVFEEVRDGINRSITGVSEISSQSCHLDELRTDVIDVVQSLTSIAEQNAASTEETSASVIEVSNTMQTILDNANHLNEIASILDKNMSEFTL